MQSNHHFYQCLKGLSHDLEVNLFCPSGYCKGDFCGEKRPLLLQSHPCEGYEFY